MRKQKGVEIFVPVMQSNKQLKKSIHEGTENGKFNIGEPVTTGVIRKEKKRGKATLEPI